MAEKRDVKVPWLTLVLAVLTSLLEWLRGVVGARVEAKK
jgi:hypothetical protein